MRRRGAGQVERTYHAIVLRAPVGPRGIVESRIARDPRDRKKMAALPIHDTRCALPPPPQPPPPLTRPRSCPRLDSPERRARRRPPLYFCCGHGRW